MKKLYLRNVLATLFAASVVFVSCEKDDVGSPSGSGEGTVTDVEGNIYKTITIGDQVWMAENLRATQYADGTSIPNVSKEYDWRDLNDNNTDKAYCWYNNSIYNKDTYGALYTYAAATNGNNGGNIVQGVCPDGWHLPGNDEWNELEEYISKDGHDGAEGIALKADSGWYNYGQESGNGTDVYGFAALTSGYRVYATAVFDGVGHLGNWWSSTEYNSTDAYYCYLSYRIENIGYYNLNKSNGHSVRCVRD